MVMNQSDDRHCLEEVSGDRSSAALKTSCPLIVFWTHFSTDWKSASIIEADKGLRWRTELGFGTLVRQRIWARVGHFGSPDMR